MGLIRLRSQSVMVFRSHDLLSHLTESGLTNGARGWR